MALKYKTPMGHLSLNVLSVKCQYKVQASLFQYKRYICILTPSTLCTYQTAGLPVIQFISPTPCTESSSTLSPPNDLFLLEGCIVSALEWHGSERLFILFLPTRLSDEALKDSPATWLIIWTLTLNITQLPFWWLDNKSSGSIAALQDNVSLNRH